MTDIILAIKAIKADAEVSVNGETVEGIIWHDDNPTNITNEQILAKQAELQAEFHALEYSRNRAKEYPSIGDQLDMQYWDKINATSIWSDLITKIKSDNPKE